VVTAAAGGSPLFGPALLAECYRKGVCVDCRRCTVRAPLSGHSFAELRERARQQIAGIVQDLPEDDRQDEAKRTLRERRRELREARGAWLDELQDAEARASIRRRTEQIMHAEQLAAQWEAEDRQAADRALVAAVAERRRREAAA
jgi:hypothetical protein